MDVIPIQELLHRIQWDAEFARARFEIAYEDHAVPGLQRVPFEAVRLQPTEPFGFEAMGADGEERFIPFHRVREVYRDGTRIWQRPAHAPGKAGH